MAYIARTVTTVAEIADADLDAYLAAGWKKATAAQVAEALASDPYGGLQGLPMAAPLPPERVVLPSQEPGPDPATVEQVTPDFEPPAAPGEEG